MRSDKPSSTAAIVAAARATIDADPTIEGFSDPYAERLLPPGYALERGRTLRGRIAGVTRRLTRHAAHIIALRMVAIDEGIRTAPALDQLVILGAGLDARAWRLPELADIDVFEVDHPATQAAKRERASQFRELPRHHYVGVDFERDSIAERLAEAGHRADVPTVWIWEGVTMYLGIGAIEATLRSVQACSAPLSRLLVTYLPPSGFRLLVATSTALFGERMHAAFVPTQMAALLDRFGFEVVCDESAVEWHDRWALPHARLLPGFASTERLATADRR